MFRTIVVVVSVWALGGCAYFFDPPPVDIVQDAPTQFVIGAGDELAVSVWRNDALDRTVTVRPDGHISLPLVGDIKAAGLTPMALSGAIEEELASIIQDPRVTVNVGAVAARSESAIRVVGEAIQPQLVPYYQGITLIDVITSAGGLSEFADGNRAYIVRFKDGERTRYRVRLGSLLKHGDMRANVKLAPGDILVVPERWY